MSLILDALKKLEKDKVTRRKRSVHIASDILFGGAPEETRRARILIAGLAGLAGLAVVLVLVWMNILSPRRPVPEQTKIPAPPTAAAVSSQPAGASPSSDQVAKSVQAPGAAAVKRKTVTMTARTPRTDEKPSGPATRSKQKTALRTSPAKTAASDTGPLPTFTVSGIVWAESRGNRRAMVNGAVVGEGGNVDGAKVTEIHQDHVRFSHQGRPFSVYMK